MEYGCIGERLTHSFSKEIHPQLAGYDYELREVEKDALADFMTAKDFKAINVTIPYKQTVIPFLYRMVGAASDIGAVNTVVNRNGRLFGYNTDFDGMLALIERNQIEVQNKKVLILGSGGTSKTAAAVAKFLGAAQIFRVSRSGNEGCITYDDAKKAHNDAHIIINTTPSGMYPNIGVSAVDISDFPQLCGVIDAVYNPLRSALVIAASKRGIKAAGGLYMLVAQAAYAAQLFTDRHDLTDKIDSIYNNLLRSKQNLVLIGMPGCGKTTVGREIARSLCMDFVDTDEEIVKTEKRPITEIFACKGEQYFRKKESEIIYNCAARQHTVIATGGGVVLNSQNIELLSENGKIIFLDRPCEKIAATADRPLSKTKEALEKLYNERYKIYCEAADIRVKCDSGILSEVNAIREAFFHEDFSD